MLFAKQTKGSVFLAHKTIVSKSAYLRKWGGGGLDAAEIASMPKEPDGQPIAPK